MEIHELRLVDVSVPDTATFAEGSAALLAAGTPAIAVVGADRRLVGVLALADVLRAVFPRYLGELRHTSFLPDDQDLLEQSFNRVRDEPVQRFSRAVEPLDQDESQTHAAERFIHTGEPALPVVEVVGRSERFVGMLSLADLCHARLDPPVERFA
jgi:CBS domain-containing protein